MRTIQTDFLLTGGYGSNLGDDAMLISILMELKKTYANCSIVVFCYNKDNIPNEARIAFDKVIYFDRADQIHIIADCRIYGGGNQHFIFEKNNLKFVGYKRKIEYQFNNSREILFALKKRFGKVKFTFNKTVYFGVGLGPFKTKPDLSYLNDSLVILREKLSITHYSDSVLGCDPCFNPQFINALDFKTSKSVKDISKPNIGIIVRDWYHDFKLNEEIFKDIQNYINILKPSHRVTIINFCKVVDFQYKSLLSDYDDEIIYDSRKHHFYEFISQINSMDGIISMRYHGLVFATILNIPSIGINIDPKIEQFTKEFSSPYLATINIGTNELELLQLIRTMLEDRNLDRTSFKVVDFFESRYKTMIKELLAYTNSDD